MIKITDNIFQGDMTSAIKASFGGVVDSIVYLGQEIPEELSHRSKIPVIHILMNDGECHEDLINLAFHNIYYFTYGKVLVACRAGISRSPAILIGYFAVYELPKINWDKAFKFIKKKIPQAHPEPHLLEAVKKVTEGYKI